MPGAGAVHADVAATAMLSPRVGILIQGHVAAKRYLVTEDGAYRDELSGGSLRTLAVQGGAMAATEAAAFARTAHFDATVRLRRADEAAKGPDAVVPDLDHWLPTLARLYRVAR